MLDCLCRYNAARYNKQWYLIRSRFIHTQISIKSDPTGKTKPYLQSTLRNFCVVVTDACFLTYCSCCVHRSAPHARYSLHASACQLQRSHLACVVVGTAKAKKVAAAKQRTASAQAAAGHDHKEHHTKPSAYAGLHLTLAASRDVLICLCSWRRATFSAQAFQEHAEVS